MRLLEQSSVFQSNGQQDRTMISAKNKRTIFRTPQQPEPAALHLESRNYEEDEEILVEEYDDWWLLEPAAALFNVYTLIYNRSTDTFGCLR